ncbi:hypothetical protein [Acinetobacter wuhouensis]|uniref:Uncharacterized protein n=1 Tax=Acinetobacter wuhouensis TaxID=1879050 RepID=A0A3G2T2M2_9GAMM|nr:hypothetical protein [Acinetobacter wuhouensis]AYO54222.1 hypothetical protein CDG68_11510 [Acinetobacter wuhouensis]
MNWAILLNFLTALAIIPPILRWCFFRSYRIELKRKDYESNSLQLSKYIKSTYKEKANKEPSELQAETDTFLVGDVISYKIVFHALDLKISRLFEFLKNIKYAKIFLDIDTNNEIPTFKSKLTEKEIKYFFNITFGFHIFATILWGFSYIIDSDTFFGIPKSFLVLIILCITATSVRFSTQAKTVELLSKDINVQFPS